MTNLLPIFINSGVHPNPSDSMNRNILLAIFLTSVVIISGCAGKISQTEVDQQNSQSTSAAAPRSPPANVSDFGYVEVIKVVDGDTIDVRINGVVERIRLIGIDTPETLDPRKPVQCFGPEATKKAKDLLSGKKVFLEIDSSQGERDKYERLLRYVFLEDKTNFNQFMISEGFAREYTYKLPYKYQAQFRQAERDAQLSKKGLWSACPKGGETSTILTSTHADMNCDDFLTQKEAQDYFVSNGGSSANNVNGLDDDRDGIVCESLPEK